MEIKVIKLNDDRVMKFYCPSCIKYNTFDLYKSMIVDKERLIESKDEIIRLLK